MTDTPTGPYAGRSRLIDLDHMASITEANQRGLSRLAREAREGVPTVLVHNGTPCAAVLPLDAYFLWRHATDNTEEPSDA